MRAPPGQRAVGGGELVAARAGVGGPQLHLNVDRGVLANRQADSRARFIGEPLFCRSNLEAPRRVSGRNQLVGRIESVQISGLMAEVRVSIGGQQITSIITARSAKKCS
jgi:ABC-type molybdate transport system ATPase subunit